MRAPFPVSLACGIAPWASLLLLAGPAAQQHGPDPRAVLETALAEAGIRIDLDDGRCAVPARILVREELLEYLLVGPGGSAHESLFVTDVKPSLVNTALLALGFVPGVNASWTRRTEPLRDEERRAGVSPYDVTLPKGDSLYLYALWEEDGEVYFYRIEDLIRNLSTGRTMRRHSWVYLGSRFVPLEEEGEEVFVADREQNLLNIALFAEGNTLVTAALATCIDQTIWVGNTWLLPERDWPLLLVFSRNPLVAPPDDLLGTLHGSSEVHVSGDGDERK